MTARSPLAIALALTCFACGAHAAGPQTGGVKIKGAVTQNVTVGRSANVATGERARAFTSIGSIGSGVTIDGDLTMDVQVDEVVNLADGPKRQAITSVGSIHRGADVSGRREITVSTGTVVNAPDGDEPSCVIVGSIGDIEGCE